MESKSILIFTGNHSMNLERVLAFLSTYQGNVFLIQNPTDSETRNITKIINRDPNSRQNLAFVANSTMINWDMPIKRSRSFLVIIRNILRVVMRRAFIRKLLIQNSKKIYFYFFRITILRSFLLMLKARLLRIYFGPVVANTLQENLLFSKVSIGGKQLKDLAMQYNTNTVIFVDLEAEIPSVDDCQGLKLLSIKGPSALINLRDAPLKTRTASQFNFDRYQRHFRIETGFPKDSILFISGNDNAQQQSIKMEYAELLNISRHMGIENIDVFSHSGRKFSSNLFENIKPIVSERPFYSVESQFFTFIDNNFSRYRFVIFNGFFSESIPWVDYFRAAFIYQTTVLVPHDFPHAGGALIYNSDIELDLRDKILFSVPDFHSQNLQVPFALTLEQWLDLELN